jgi:hypothetical protein
MADFKHTAQIRIASGINVLLGAFLSASPWLLNYASQETDLTRNSVIIGALVVVCAALRTVWPSAKAAFSGANIAFGFWTLISSWTYGRTADQMYVWLSLALGVAIMGLAAWSGNATLAAQRRQTFHS